MNVAQHRGHSPGTRAASCEGKERFACYQQAAEVLNRRARKGLRGQLYRCSHCGGFHLGTASHKPRGPLKLITLGEDS